MIVQAHKKYILNVGIVTLLKILIVCMGEAGLASFQPHPHVFRTIKKTTPVWIIKHHIKYVLNVGKILYKKIQNLVDLG